MTRSYKDYSYILSGFIFLLSFFLILTRYGGYMIPFMSLVTIMGIGLIFYMAGIRWSFHLVILTLPFSMNMPISESHQVMFPSELLITAFAFSVLLHWFRNNNLFITLLQLPATIALLGYI